MAFLPILAYLCHYLYIGGFDLFTFYTCNVIIPVTQTLYPCGYVTLITASCVTVTIPHTFGAFIPRFRCAAAFACPHRFRFIWFVIPVPHVTLPLRFVVVTDLHLLLCAWATRVYVASDCGDLLLRYADLKLILPLI